MKQFLAIIISILCLGSFAQKGILQGTLIDSQTKKPLVGAHIELTQLPDSIVFAFISQVDGSFKTDALKPATYQIHISFVGYKAVVKPIVLNSGLNDLGPIAMVFDDINLGGVQVTAEAPAIQIKGDTTEYAASAYKTQPDATTEDLVQKMHGVTIEDGKINELDVAKAELILVAVKNTSPIPNSIII